MFGARVSSAFKGGKSSYMKHGLMKMHLRNWGRHDANRGLSQGYEADNSDIEWEEHVTLVHGYQGDRRWLQQEIAVDDGADIQGLLHDIACQYDELQDKVAETAERQEAEELRKPQAQENNYVQLNTDAGVDVHDKHHNNTGKVNGDGD